MGFPLESVKRLIISVLQKQCSVILTKREFVLLGRDSSQSRHRGWGSVGPLESKAKGIECS